jgi:hypothetical protein
MQVLRIIASVGTVLTGLVSMFWPRAVFGFTGLTAESGRGITEIRAVLGAFFVGLGGAALYFNAPEAYRTLGVTYLVVAVTRAISMFVDDSVVQSNIISVITEVILGIMLVL